MRGIAGALTMILVLGGCTATEEPAPTTTTVATPTDAVPRDVVTAWIQSVIASDAGALGDLVEPEGLVILAAIENGYSETEIVGLLDSGIPPDLLSEYWASFRSGFAEVAGIPLQAVEVTNSTEFRMGEIEFSVVAVSSRGATTEMLLNRRSGVWRLDLIASFGAAFAAQLRRLVGELSTGPQGERIRVAYRDAIVPGLLAAFRMQPGNRILQAELERIALTLES